MLEGKDEVVWLREDGSASAHGEGDAVVAELPARELAAFARAAAWWEGRGWCALIRWDAGGDE